MEYIHNVFVDNEDILLARKQKRTINVRFCRTCPFFQINGVQPVPGITRGWCQRLSFEGDGKYTPHYVHVDSNSFCNDDHASNEDEYQIL